MGMVTKLSARAEIALSRVTGNATPQALVNHRWSKDLADGNGTGQANLVIQEQYSLAASATQVVDFNAILNDLGQTQTFTGIKGMMFTCPIANGAAVVSVADNATEGFADWLLAATDAVRVPAGGCFMITNPEGAGWPSGNNTDDKLLLTNLSGSVAAVINVIIVGIGSLS